MSSPNDRTSGVGLKLSFASGIVSADAVTSRFTRFQLLETVCM